MDATEADDGAQLFGLFRQPRARVPVDDHDCSSSRLTQPVHAARTVNSSKELFDVFADLPATDATLADVPATVTQFNMAAGDLGFKQYQDDMSTRLPWADVEDDEDVDDHPFDAIVDEATAEFNPQELQAQCGPYEFVNEQHEPCAPDDADTQGFDSHSGPQSDIHVPGDYTDMQGGFTQTLRTQYGLLPSDGFQDFARQVLPDVYPNSDASEAFSDDAALSEEDFSLKGSSTQTQQTPCSSLVGACTVLSPMWSHLKDFSSQEDPPAQFGPSLEGGSTQQAPCSALGGALESSHGLAHAGSEDGDCAVPEFVVDGRPLKDFEGSSTQQTPCSSLCGASSVIHPSSLECSSMQQTPCSSPCGASSVISPTSLAGSSTQQTPCFPLCGASSVISPTRLKDFTSLGQGHADPIPHELDYEYLNIFDLDLDANGTLQQSVTQCGPLPQQPTPRTQCEPLDLQPLKDTLAQLLATSLAPSPSIEARLAALEAYAAATHETLGHFPPVPQQHLQSAPRVDTPRTQSELLPLKHKTPSSGASLQLGPTPRQAAKVKQRKGSKGKGKGKGLGKTGG